ncbi:MAG: MiaB/RimO family radical SAM methylthiotransferase [Coriobacteriales bacterium]
MTPIRFHITTHGCRVNRVESDAIAAQLLAAGWEQAPLEEAQIALLNTCTVTGEADHKNRKAIRQALKRQSGPVLVTGCAVNVAAASYEALDSRVFCEPDKAQVAARALALLSREGGREGTGPAGGGDAGDVTRGDRPREERAKRGQAPQEAAVPATSRVGTGPAAVGDVARGDRPRSLVPYGEGFRTRSGIKVQDGCDNACTFCIVHTARGPARSEDPREVLRQASELVEAGARELVLVGIDTGAYRWGDMDLAGLIALLLEKTSVGRIRIPSIEPQSVTQPLMELLSASEGRLCRHLHLVMQSGSSKVLGEMDRRYNAGEFLELVQELRRRVPGIALSTDVIAGFPGETDEDFEATCEMVRDCGFMKLHVFPYSKRPGTPAAQRTDQVPPQLIAERAARLGELGRQLSLEDARSRLGCVETAVVERPGRGTSESFHELRFSDELPLGELVHMRLDSVGEDGVISATAL